MTFAEYKEAFTGNAYVVLEKSTDVERIDKWQNSFLQSIRRYFATWYTWFLVTPARISWTYERSAEPSDINWENQGLGIYIRLWRMMVSFNMSGFILVCVGYLVFFIKIASKGNKQDNSVGYKNTPFSFDIDAYITAFILTYINDNLVGTMRFLAKYESFPNKTEEQVSVAFKLLCIKLTNFVWIPIFISGLPQNWFKAGGLIGTIRALIIVNIWKPPVMYAINPGKYFKALRLKVIRLKGDAKVKMNQNEANAFMDAGTLDPAQIVSEYGKFFCACIFYSSILPAAIPGCVLGTATQYWTLKYKLLRRCKKPDMFGESLATFFGALAPLAVFGQCMGIVTLYFAMTYINATWVKENLEVFVGPDYVVTPEQVLRDAEITKFFMRPIDQMPFPAPSVFVLALGIAFSAGGFMWIPFGAIIMLCRKKPSADTAAEPRYENLYTTFSTDYDKENPNTKSIAGLREVDYGIKIAEKNKDQELKGKLIARRETVIKNEEVEIYLRNYTAKLDKDKRPKAWVLPGPINSRGRPKLPGQETWNKYKEKLGEFTNAEAREAKMQEYKAQMEAKKQEYKAQVDAKKSQMMTKLPEKPKGGSGFKVGSMIPKMKMPDVASLNPTETRDVMYSSKD